MAAAAQPVAALSNLETHKPRSRYITYYYDTPGCRRSHPLIISLHSARMKCSFSGVRMHSEFFWPVRDSPSTTSEHWFMLIVPWGRVLGCRGDTTRHTSVQCVEERREQTWQHVPPLRMVCLLTLSPPLHRLPCQAWLRRTSLFLLGACVIFLFSAHRVSGFFFFSYFLPSSVCKRKASYDALKPETWSHFKNSALGGRRKQSTDGLRSHLSEII